MRTVALLVFLVTIAWSARARGEESSQERARPHVEAGGTAFENEEYEVAIREFRAAYELLERPMLLYNIAVCHERLEQRREAVEAYFEYLSAAPEAENAGEVRERIDRIQAERVEERDRETEIEAVDQGEASGNETLERIPLESSHHEIGVLIGTNFSVYSVHSEVASFSLAASYHYRITPTWHVGAEILMDWYGNQVGDVLGQSHYGFAAGGRWAIQLGRRFELHVQVGLGYQALVQPRNTEHWIFLRAGSTVVWDVYRGFGFRISLNTRLGYLTFENPNQFGVGIDLYGGLFWAF